MTLTSQTEFRELFEGERERLQRFLRHLTGNAVDAEDLCQETFLTVWRKRDQFEGRGSVAGYLRSTAFRLYLNQRELRQRRAALEPDPVEATTPAPEEDVEHDEAVRFLIARVRSVLASLSDEAREAFVMFRFEGMTCAEIAELTDTNVKTIETRVRRATHEVAERLKPYRDHLPVRNHR